MTMPAAPATSTVTATSRANPRTSGNGPTRILTRPPGPQQPPRPGRYVPPESLLQAMEDAIAAAGEEADVRLIALREVQRARVPVEEKFKLFIPAGALARAHHIDAILAAINSETQTSTWNASLSAVCDFIRIPGRGIRFTCTSRAVATKLGGTAVRIFGSEYIIKTVSVFDSMYYVDLKNVPSDLDDGVLFDYFAARGLKPILTPTFQVGTLSSRDRTAWFATPDCPAGLMEAPGVALREIQLPDFPNVIFVNHKNRRLNTTPPSILRREEERRAKKDTPAPVPTSPGPEETMPLASPGLTPEVSLTPMAHQDPVLDIALPEPTDPFVSWAEVTKPISISRPCRPPSAQQHEVVPAPTEDGRCVFGIPCKPTRFELAFNDLEDADAASDVDAVVYVDETPVAARPLLPPAATGTLIAMQSFLSTPRTKLHRKQLRALAKQASASFHSINEPEARIAALTAHPHAVQPAMALPSPALDNSVAEHAILRYYSGRPASTHGTAPQFLPRLQIDYPESSPSTDTLLQLLYPSVADRDRAEAIALADLLLRAHAPSIYHDPIKVAAFVPMASPSFLQYSTFLLWSDEVVIELWTGALGDRLVDRLPDYAGGATSMLRTLTTALLASKSPWCLRGISININGLNNVPRYLFQQLYSSYDVIALQETKFSSSDNVRRASHFSKVCDSKSQAFWSHPTTPEFQHTRGRDGVGLLFSGRHPFTSLQDVTSVHASPALANNYLVVQATVDSTVIFFHVIYAPVLPADRRIFFRNLPTEFPDGALHVALGDFNVTSDAILDSIIPCVQDAGRSEFLEWQLRMGLLDAWRSTYPHGREFTGPGRRNRIDYCLLSPLLFSDFLTRTSHVLDQRFHHEDHLPVSFVLKSPDSPLTSKLPWKCPRWLLKHPIAHRVLESTLGKLCAKIRCGPCDNPGALLDEHKRQDSIFLRRLHTELSALKQAEQSHLILQLRAAETQHAEAPSESTRIALETSKAELSAHLNLVSNQKEQSKFDNDIRFGEKASTSFLRQPYSENIRVSIPAARLPDGSTTSDPAEMAACHRSYWAQIFQSPSEDLRSTVSKSRFNPVLLAELLSHTTARLTEADRRYLDAPMTAHDFYWAITKSAKGKSSGLDGLPIEYYQLFPHKWAQVYELVYASQLKLGRMTKFQRRACISLLYKKGDRADPGNYRPITLLNHDAKLGPKILARRLRDILPKLLHTDQFGFVNGRSIRHASIQFQDLQQFCRTQGLQDAGAVLLDFAKAFDSVLWPALDMVLRHFGFPPAFRHAVFTFYRGTIVTILLNGIPSKYFELGCGVRQGDPLSPALFVIFMEPLLCYLRSTVGNLGIKLPSHVVKFVVQAFADDCTGLLRNLANTPIFLNAVSRYSHAAGLKLNVLKTVVLPFQPCTAGIRDRLTRLGLSVTADDGSTRLLGIWHSPSLNPTTRFDSIIPSIVSRCTLWQHRGRTLRGRAVILRSIILPLIWYTAAVTPMPDRTATQIRNLCKAFLFKKTIDTVSVRAPFPEEWISWPSTRGGLGIPSPRDFSSALHLCSLRDAIVMTATSHCIPRWFQAGATLCTLASAGAGITFDILYAQIPTTSAPSRFSQILGPFWSPVLRIWQRLRTAHVNLTALTKVADTAPLWNNFMLMVGDGPRPRTLEKSSTLLGHIRDQDIIRLTDLPADCDPEACKTYILGTLSTVGFASPRLRTLAASQFTAKLMSFHLFTNVRRYGPQLPDEVLSASHPWRLNEIPMIKCSNRFFYKLLHQLPPIPILPHIRLGISTEPDWGQMWRTDLSLDKKLLPILSDLRFRLQHNGLLTRNKFGFTGNDIACPHGCHDVETPEHLFWNCPVAKTVWARVLLPLQAHLDAPLSWSGIVYLLDLSFKDSSMAQYGRHQLLLLVHILRCSSLYPIWIHRNHRIFQQITTSASAVTAHALAYARLHLHATTDSDNTRWATLAQEALGLLANAPPEAHP